MNKSIIFCTLLIPMSLWADPFEAFAAAKKEAAPVGGLGVFLERYVGDCGNDAFEGAECQRKTLNFRKETVGRRYYTQISEDSAMVSVGRTYGGEVDLLVTPFFAAGRSALTHGAPTQTDSQGNPVVPFLVVKTKIPDDMDAATLGRLASMRGLRLEVVFTPQGVWTLPKKGGGKMQGVRGKFYAVSIAVARTSEGLSSWRGK